MRIGGLDILSVFAWLVLNLICSGVVRAQYEDGEFGGFDTQAEFDEY